MAESSFDNYNTALWEAIHKKDWEREKVYNKHAFILLILYMHTHIVHIVVTKMIEHWYFQQLKMMINGDKMILSLLFV